MTISIVRPRRPSRAQRSPAQRSPAQTSPVQPLPSPAAESRPTTQMRKRDRYIDSLRALALIRIMTYHYFGWAWLPILFPSVGIMFALAGSLIASSLDRSPGNPWRVLKKRTIRLLPPVWLLGVVLVTVMVVAGWTHTVIAGDPLDWRTLLFWVVPISTPIGSALGADWVLPLWYIRTYLWFLLLSPATLWLFRHWPKRMVAIPVTAVLLSAIGVLQLDGRSGDVILSVAMFGGCWMLGFAHHDNKIRSIPLARVLVGGALLMALGLAWAFTHQDPVSGWDIDNIPVADTLYCLGAVLILLRLYPDFSWMERRVVLDKIITVINSRAMTIYLWGNFAIFLANPILDLWSVTANLDQNNAVGIIQAYLMSWLIVIAFVFLLGWCEDLAAGRRLRINPWPRSKTQLDTMRTRRVLTFPRPSWLADLAPRRLFIVTSCLLAFAVALSTAALVGTHTPGSSSVADAPPQYAVQSRPHTPPPANLGQGNTKPVAKVPDAPAVALAQPWSVLTPVNVAPPGNKWVMAKTLTGVTHMLRVPAVPTKHLPTIPVVPGTHPIIVPVVRQSTPAPTKAPVPAPTKAPVPTKTTAPPPVTTTAPPPVTTTAPPPVTTTAPPPVTTPAPPPVTTPAPPPVTTAAPPPVTTAAPPPVTTPAPTTTATPTPTA
jgi:peptidoglycan/LPS O-acetylase OafA/YrhL